MYENDMLDCNLCQMKGVMRLRKDKHESYQEVG